MSVRPRGLSMIRIGRGLGLRPEHLGHPPRCLIRSLQVAPRSNVERFALELMQPGQHLGQQPPHLAPGIACRWLVFVLLHVLCRPAVVAVAHAFYVVIDYPSGQVAPTVQTPRRDGVYPTETSGRDTNTVSIGLLSPL